MVCTNLLIVRSIFLIFTASWRWHQPHTHHRNSQIDIDIPATRKAKTRRWSALSWKVAVIRWCLGSGKCRKISAPMFAISASRYGCRSWKFQDALQNDCWSHLISHSLLPLSCLFLFVKAGYRRLDFACDYGNEKQCGEGIQKAIEDGLVKREDLFVTSKVSDWKTPRCRKLFGELLRQIFHSYLPLLLSLNYQNKIALEYLS